MIQEIPFNAKRKRMTTLHNNLHGNRIITKGAIDYILPLCTKYKSAQKAEPLTAVKRKNILEQNKLLADQALRVIAVAYADTSEKEISEKNMTFIGLIAMADPPRPEAVKAISTCRKAGIKPVMITGDHPATAYAVAREINLADDIHIMTGAELDHTPQDALAASIEKYNIFARVTPEHKVRIVKAWQSRKRTVAMTGDGVNDAPALKAADIGCSLGVTGTEVAKSSSDMILSDDNFATIVDAVYQGRTIYQNIKKSIRFLLSSNIGEILTIFCALLLGWAAPLTAIQLLWVNLVTDSLPAIALGMDPPSPDIMERKPDRSGLFSKGMISEVLLEGGIIGSLALLAFSVGFSVFSNLTIARTMAFAVLSISQLVHAFNMRSDNSVFRAGLFKNKALIFSFIAGIILQTSVINIPFFASMFKVCPLTPTQWSVVGLLSLMPLVIVELSKLFGKKIEDEK